MRKHAETTHVSNTQYHEAMQIQTTAEAAQLVLRLVIRSLTLKINHEVCCFPRLRVRPLRRGFVIEVVVGWIGSLDWPKVCWEQIPSLERP